MEGAGLRLPRLAETEAHLSIHTFGMELNFNGLPNNAVHVTRLSGKNEGSVKLNAVSEAEAVFSCS